MSLRILSLAVVLFLVGSDEFILSSLLSSIGADFGVAPGRVATMVTAFALPYALLAPFFGRLSDRIGRRRVLFPALFVFVLATAGTAVSESLPVALLSRLLTGAAAAAIVPNVFALVGDLTPAPRRPAAMGAVQLGLTLGLILSPALGVAIADAGSWRMAFWGIAGLGLAALLVAALALPRTPASAVSADGADAAAGPTDAARLARRPGAVEAVAVMGLGLGVAIGTFSIVGEILRDRYGLTGPVLSGAYVVFGVATVLGNTLTGAASRRFGGPARSMCMALLGIAAGIALLCAGSGAGGTAAAAAGLVLWAVFGGIGAPAQQAVLADIGGAQRGSLLAWGSAAMNLGIAGMTAVEAAVYVAFGAEGIGAVALAALAAAVLLQNRLLRRTRLQQAA